MSDEDFIRGPTAARASRGARSAFAAFAFLARSLQQISAFIVTLVAAGYLAPAIYGIYALAVVFVTLIQTLTYTGIYHFIVTTKAEERRVISTGFWLLTGLSSLAALLIALAAPLIARLFDAPELARVIILLCAVQPFAGAGAWSSAVLLRRQRVQAHFSVMFWTNLAALIGGVAFLVLWQSLWALVAYRYVRVLSANLLYGFILRERPALAFERALAREALAYAGGLYGARFLSFLSRFAGDLLLGAMFSTAEAGLYRFGTRLASGATDIVTQTMQNFALSQLGAAGRSGRDMTPLLTRFIGTSVLLTGGAAATIVVLGPGAVAVFFDPAYAAGMAVAYAMAMRALLGIGQTMLDPVMAACGKTGAVMRFNLGLTVAAIGLALATAPFGLGPLAWSQAGLAAVATALALRMIRRVAGLSVGGAVRAYGGALVLVAGYGAALWAAWQGLEPWLGGGAALAAGLGAACVLGAATVLAGWRLKLFSLAAFSG